MNKAVLSLGLIASVLSSFLSSQAAYAIADREPIGGQPAFGQKASTNDLEYQVMYQRAFEAVLWSMPAVAAYRFRAGAFDHLGITDNDVLAYSGVATPKLEALTANSNTPYLGAYADLRHGPVVLEVPAADETGSLYGQVIDAWQLTIADVGPSGLDKGLHAKYLFTPPGYDKPIPEGYIHVASPNYRIAFAFRSVPGKGKTLQDAFEYSKKLKMYNLSDAASPKPTHFIDPINMRYPTLPIYDERYFDDVYNIVNVEPIAEKDKMMVGSLKSIGIERGKPFKPSDKQKRAMRQAVVDAYYYMDSFWDKVDSRYYFWKDRHYVTAQFTDNNRRFSYDYPDSIDIDGRAAAFFNCTYMPKMITDKPANQYLVAQADKNGQPFVAGKTYRINVPANMPVKQFWSLTVYDRATFAFIYTDSGRTNLSSFDLSKMKKEADGSVNIYIGPKAPTGLESNWIPTRGKRPFPLFRFYGVTDALNDKQFELNDFEIVKNVH